MRGRGGDRRRHGDKQLLKNFFEVSWRMTQLMVTKQLLKSFFEIPGGDRPRHSDKQLLKSFFEVHG
jgi:hypothetical protein